MNIQSVNAEVDRKSVIKHFNNGDNKTVSHGLKNKIKKCMHTLQQIMNPRIAYKTWDIKSADRASLQLQNGVQFKSLKLTKTLRYSEKLVCFLVTLGHGVDREIAGLMQNNSLSEAYILDSMASVTVENMTEQFQQNIEKQWSRKGRHATLRFSPGYCDWKITEQVKIFSLMDLDQVDVELTDSCLMEPRKSVSGVFGIAPVHTPKYNPCFDCPNRDCTSRRAPYVRASKGSAREHSASLSNLKNN